jgi:glycine dehydrogenase subunit 2
MRNTLATQLIFDLSSPGRRASAVPAADVPAKPLDTLLPARFRGTKSPALPEVTEGEVIRHFVNLSTRNMSVDTHFYPLGSCTMKYNPKRHERLSSLEGIVDIHPYQSVDSIQGMLAILFEMQQMLGEISGLPGVSLQPAAGAQGEFAALLVAGAYFRDRGEKRTTVIFPNSAHGTNPASAALAGFQTVQIASTPAGYVDLEDLARNLNDQTAVFMVTNPNTLGLFEQDITRIAEMVHRAGALVYIDGANMNAICGITRPGDFGGDMQHYNVHKTFTGPHGAGGPGSGPIAVRDFLADYLPGPVVTRTARPDGGYTYALTNPPKSIGRVRSFFGNVGILIRGYCYLRTLGAQGVRDMSRHAVLNANYLLARLKDVLPVPQGDRCLHEFVASAKVAKERGFTAMDIAKRLLDYGFHAPTVYFPLNVPEALMIEPTETESKQTLDAFADALRKILTEDAEVLKGAPHSTEINRPDDVRAARQPVLRCLLKDG